MSVDLGQLHPDKCGELTSSGGAPMFISLKCVPAITEEQHRHSNNCKAEQPMTCSAGGAVTGEELSSHTQIAGHTRTVHIPPAGQLTNKEDGISRLIALLDACGAGVEGRVDTKEGEVTLRKHALGVMQHRDTPAQCVGQVDQGLLAVPAQSTAYRRVEL